MTDKLRGQIRRGVLVTFVSCLIGILILLILYSKINFNIGVLCPLHTIFGINCPGCGGTRMAVAMIKGEWYQAFRFNAWLLLYSPFLVIIYIKQIYQFVRYNKVLEEIDTFLIVFVVVGIIFGVIRNIPPFTWLGPTVIE